jgi:hypothetical protein
MRKFLLWCYVISVIFVMSEVPGFCSNGFNEDFNSPTLDPAWQVVEYTGTRVYGYPYPANSISLTDNPGYLRYDLYPMTYPHGFLNDYQIYTAYYSYDYGLELHRVFTGDQWVFESKADYYMPYTNGRDLSVRIYFGDGGIDTYFVGFTRVRDVNQNHLGTVLWHKYGPSFEDFTRPQSVQDPQFDLYGPPNHTFYCKLIREGGLLTAMWSEDGNSWNTTFIHDMGSQLDGLDQRVVITGGSWFNSAGSYADYDYVKVTPLVTVINCALDIDPNTLNLKSKGKWITAYIELPVQYNAADINLNAVKLHYDTGEVPAGWGDIQGNACMVKFDRKQVNDMLIGVEGYVELKVTGEVGGTPFEGTDTIKVK